MLIAHRTRLAYHYYIGDNNMDTKHYYLTVLIQCAHEQYFLSSPVTAATSNRPSLTYALERTIVRRRLKVIYYYNRASAVTGLQDNCIETIRRQTRNNHYSHLSPQQTRKCSNGLYFTRSTMIVFNKPPNVLINK